MVRHDANFYLHIETPASPAKEQLQIVKHRSDATVERVIKRYGNRRSFMKMLDDEDMGNLAVVFAFRDECPCECPYTTKQHADGCPLSLRPAYWLFKRGGFLSPKEQDELWHAYISLIERFPDILKKPRPVHSASKAAARALEGPSQHHPAARSAKHKPLHLGYWRRRSGQIHLTADTLQGGDYDRQLAIFGFMATLDRILYRNRWKAKQVDKDALHLDAKVMTD
ncbi:hypothetical protein A1Q2_05713 [Trichosporon asahii var. asahii CBS 8904]|uniref:Uncharacterized protein n=1 Tax=Trichosporon asahii var. asahii (strain CBS 8904) TaxID=1220162 RepID=K1WEE6_TRIAC|nr:hypothetical protein A1Q2_05713 [Trichosporon asahii var. asahii CBS 8904]